MCVHGKHRLTQTYLGTVKYTKTKLLPNCCVQSGLSHENTDSDSGRLTYVFERNSSFSRMTSCDYWKVVPQFVPLTGLHSDICVLI